MVTIILTNFVVTRFINVETLDLTNYSVDPGRKAGQNIYSVNYATMRQDLANPIK